MELDEKRKPARILVVDDDESMRGVLCRILGDAGHHCVPAADADEAISEFRRDPYDLVLTDIAMPGRSGLDLLQDVLDFSPQTAVVMITGVEGTKNAFASIESGAYGYVLKPFYGDDVVITIANALHRRNLEIENREYREQLKVLVQEQVDEIYQSRQEIAMRLIIASEYRDNETGAHIRRIGRYAEVFGKLIGYSGDIRGILGLAAAMHDVGKVGIPDSILRKPGRLDPAEWEMMKTHTLIGGRILTGIDIPLLVTAREISVSHHERWDGAGYPSGLSREAIPEAARMVAVLDVYDALTHARPYKDAWPEEAAVAEMVKGRAEQFDAELLDLFLGNIESFREVRLTIPDPKRTPEKALDHKRAKLRADSPHPS